MKRVSLFAALAAASFLAVNAVNAAGFTYHGSLQDAGKPANGTYDVELTLYSAQTGGSVIGGPLTIYAVPVQGGNFSTEADFGPLAKAFSQAYVGVKVRSAGKGDFAALDTRAAVTVNAAASCPGSWDLLGNAGNPAGSYLGTADALPLVLKAGGQQIVRTDLPSGTTIPRWLGGGIQNGSSTGAEAGFIGNGGSNTVSGDRNQVGNYSAVVGGKQNSAGYGAASGYAFIGGGQTNSANADYATVGGGDNNTASDANATVPGGFSNTASGYASFAAGYGSRAGGNESFALGSYGIVRDATAAGGSGGDFGTFIWSDTSGTDFFTSTGTNQFLVRAIGGVGINTANGPLGTEPLGGTELTIASTGGDGHQTWLDMLSRSSASSIYRGFSFASTPDGIFYLNGLTNSGSSTVRTPIIGVRAGHVGINTVNGPEGTEPMSAELTLRSSSGVTGSTNFDMLARDAGDEHLGMSMTSFPDGIFELRGLVDNGSGSSTSIPVLNILSVNGGLNVSNSKFAFNHNTISTGSGSTIVVGTSTSNGNGASLTNGGMWTNASSRTFKEAFARVDALDVLSKVLAMPVQTWFYKGDHVEGRHMGPVAEDFAAKFELGNDNTHIGSVDESGVAFAAIQGLNKKLEVENSELRSKLDEVLERLNRLEAGKGQ